MVGVCSEGGFLLEIQPVGKAVLSYTTLDIFDVAVGGGSEVEYVSHPSAVLYPF